MEPAEREATSDVLQPQVERDSSKGVEASKQPTEPLPKLKQETKTSLPIHDTPTVATLSQQPWTDSQLHEWLHGGPQQPSQEVLGILAASQEPNITVGTQDSQSLQALMASEAARQAAKASRTGTAAVDTAFKETALKDAAITAASNGVDASSGKAMFVLHNGNGNSAAEGMTTPEDAPAAAPCAATAANGSPAMATDPAAAAALMAGVSSPAALHALAAAATGGGGIPAAVPGQQLPDTEFSQLQQQQYYQQLQALTYQQQLQHQRHASVAKPEHAHSTAKRRGPMDEMRQLQRILTKLLPHSAVYMPSGSDGGGNKVQAEQIKVYLATTLGEAPMPDWGLKHGWGQYLADLFNWATGRDDITNYEAMQCARRQQGRSWEVLYDKLIKLGVYSWNWDIPLRREQVLNCSKEPPKELQRQQAALAAAAATAAAAASGAGGGSKRSSAGGHAAAAMEAAAATASMSPTMMQMAMMQMAASMASPAAAAAVSNMPVGVAAMSPAIAAALPAATAAPPVLAADIVSPSAAPVAAAPPPPPPQPLPLTPVVAAIPAPAAAPAAVPAALPVPSALPAAAAAAAPAPAAPAPAASVDEAAVRKRASSQSPIAAAPVEAAASPAAPAVASSSAAAAAAAGSTTSSSSKVLTAVRTLTSADWTSCSSEECLECLSLVVQQTTVLLQRKAAAAAGESSIREGVQQVCGIADHLVNAARQLQQQLQQQQLQQQRLQQQEQQQATSQPAAADAVAREVPGGEAPVPDLAAAAAALGVAAAPYNIQQLAQLFQLTMPYAGALPLEQLRHFMAAAGAGAAAAAAVADPAAAAALPVADLPAAAAARLPQPQQFADPAAEHEEEEAEEVALSMTDHGAIPPVKLDQAAAAAAADFDIHPAAQSVLEFEDLALRRALSKANSTGKVSLEVAAARSHQRRREQQQQQHHSRGRQRGQQADYADSADCGHEESVSGNEGVVDDPAQLAAVLLLSMSQGNMAGGNGDGAASVMSSPVKSTANTRRSTKRKAAEVVDDDF